MTGRSSTERILDAYLAPEADRLPDRVIDAALADIARTPQRRALRVPWRFPNMSNLSSTARTVLVAAVLLVAVGGATYLVAGGRAPAVPTDPPSTSVATAGPTAAATLPPGIPGWTPYTSEVHGFTLSYPQDWSVYAPATREWQAGDAFPADDFSYADTFTSPGVGDAQIGLFLWEMPPGEGLDLESRANLMAWAKAFCVDAGMTSCDSFTQDATPMCLDAGGVGGSGPCEAAILVPTADHQWAFFTGSVGATFMGLGDPVVRVVVVAREDSFPGAARYGGSVALLKAILTTMGVSTPG